MQAPTLLFLDIDGTLIPFGATDPYPSYTSRHAPPETADAHPLLSRVDPGLGARLTALGCELVWATTWLTDANTCLAPWLGLPQLSLVGWPDQDDTTAPLHWKTRPLVAWAAGRPFIWIDDELTDADRTWVAARHPAPALLHRVDHRYGLVQVEGRTRATGMQSAPGRSRGPSVAAQWITRLERVGDPSCTQPGGYIYWILPLNKGVQYECDHDRP